MSFHQIQKKNHFAYKYFTYINFACKIWLLIFTSNLPINSDHFLVNLGISITRKIPNIKFFALLFYLLMLFDQHYKVLHELELLKPILIVSYQQMHSITTQFFAYETVHYSLFTHWKFWIVSIKKITLPLQHHRPQSNFVRTSWINATHELTLFYILIQPVQLIIR